MATARLTKYGVDVDFSDSEISTLSTHIATGGNTAGFFATLLAGFGVTGPAVIISGITGALLRLSSSTLNSCNAKRRGIILTVFWVGVPYCRGK
jgi:hypothetical protein